VNKTLSFAQMLILNFYWVGLSFMWNTLHPILLPAILLNYVSDTKKNTTLGFLTFAGLVIAMVIQPLAGSISDRWISRSGRRRPLMVMGTLGNFLFLSILAWGGGLIWLIIGYIALQVSSNTAQGAYQGLLPDRVNKNQHLQPDPSCSPCGQINGPQDAQPDIHCTCSGWTSGSFCLLHDPLN
jgi:MFS family permease